MKVCFFAHNWHYIRMFDEVRELLHARGIESVVLVLRKPDETYFTSLTRFDGDGSVYGFEKGGWHARAIALCDKVPFVGVLVGVWVAFMFSKHFLRSHGIGTLAVTDDRAIYFPLSLLRAAHSLRIRTVLLPIETLMLVNALESDKMAIIPKMNLVRRALRYIVRLLYPANVREREGADVHFYQPRNILPLLIFPSFLPEDPWVRGTHRAISKVLVNSRAQFEENAAHGINRKNMEVSGFPPHDPIVRMRESREGLKRDLEGQFDVPTGKVFLVLGMHFRGVYDPSDFPAVHEELRKVLELVREKVPADHTLIIKLHPGADIAEWEEHIRVLEGRHVVVIHTEWDAYRLTALADAVFMFTSSVVMAAIATDAPVVAYKLRLASFEEFYRPFTSVGLARTIPELSAALIVVSEPLSSKARALRLEDRERLGMFDGKCSERVARAIEELGKVR